MLTVGGSEIFLEEKRSNMRKPCGVFTDREEKDATFCGATDLIDQAYRFSCTAGEGDRR